MGVRLADVGVIRSLLVSKRIDDINKTIDSWKPLPSKPENLIDQEPFVNIGKGIASYLKKSGNRIKIYTEKEEELDISFNELGVRIGTGLPYLRRLANRLDPFKNYMILKANETNDHAIGARSD